MHILLIGLGNMGRKYLKKVEKLYLKPVLCDIDPKKGKGSNHPFYCHFGQVKEKIDYVIIAIDPKEHVEVSLEFLKKGIPVLLEKPPALSVEEFLKIYPYQNLEISEIELYSECVKRFPKNFRVKEIRVERLNKGKGYISPLWDLCWHDLYILLYLFKEVRIKSLKKGEVWEVEGEAGKGIPFNIRFAWNYKGEVSRRWLLNTEEGDVLMDFLKEEITFNGFKFKRSSSDKLMEMVKDFIVGKRREGSRDRALKILRILENHA